jgi:AraC-like DNA-binding protein
MLPWQAVIADKFLLRRVRAWCPKCLDEQKRKQKIIYEPLSWALATVNICVDHGIKLETKCPHCERVSSPFGGKLIVGRCSRCLGWLGNSSFGMSAHNPIDNQYDLWVAQQLGQLIAAGYKLDGCMIPQRFSNFLASFPNHVSNGNATAFARFLGISPHLYYDWRVMKTVPHINWLLKVCYRSSVSLVRLLTSDSDDSKTIKRLSRLVGPSVSHQHAQKIRTALLTALNEEPVPSIRQVAQRLGLKDPHPLYEHNSELCKALTAKHRNTRSKRARCRARIRRDADVGAIRAALQDALNEMPFLSLKQVARRLGYVRESLESRFPDLCGIFLSRSLLVKTTLEGALLQPTPPTLIDVARSLGYRNESVLRTRYPELCGKIVARRKEYRAQQLDQIEKTLQSILLINPAPKLNEVGERLGYKNFETCRDLLVKYFPELCAAIKSRLEEQRKLARQRVTTLLENAVHEDPAPSLMEVIRRTGHSKCHISSNFPIQHEAIKVRYREFQRKLATERKAEAKSKINQRLLELKAVGEFPAPIKIARACKANIGLKGTELKAVVREVRHEHGIKYSHASGRYFWNH